MKTDPYRSRNTGRDKLLTYSGLAGAFLASAGDSHAQVMYTDVDPDHVIMNGSETIDFDGDGVWDLQLNHANLYPGSSMHVRKADIDQPDGGQFIGNYLSSAVNTPIIVAPGASIGPGSPNWLPGSAAADEALLGYARVGWGQSAGNWPAQSGILGVSFIAGDGNTHYAWVELEVLPIVEAIVLKGYAYEATADTPILAGSTIALHVNGATAGQPKVDVFPNPATDQTHIRLSGSTGGTCEIHVLNEIGQVLTTRQVTLGNGTQNIPLGSEDLAAGTYFIEVRNGDWVVRRSFVKRSN